MAKDPAFLFYPNDYLGGTMGMTFEEKGAYIELLMLQFNRGHLSEKIILRLVGDLWGVIKEKFEQDEDGLWFNKRLEEEKIKRQKYNESRRKNRNSTKGKSGTPTHKDSNDSTYVKHMSEHMSKHMENENVNENINKNINKGENSNSEEKSYDYKDIHQQIPGYIFESCTPEQVRERNILIANELLSSDVWLESVARQMNRNTDTAKQKVKEFLRELETGSKNMDSLNGIRRYFSNWIRYHLD